MAGCDSKSSSPTPTAPSDRARSCADAASGSSAAGAGTAATSTTAAGTSATVIFVAVRDFSARAGVLQGMTLTSAAPTGGAVVRLESSNVDAARVPSSVTVPAGATTAPFTITTPTISSRVTVTITASYAGVERTATLTVTLGAARIIYGDIAHPRCGCMRAHRGGTELDCRLDGRGSSGAIVRWSWVLSVVERLITQRADGIFAEIDVQCRLVSGADSNTDDEGRRWVPMTISLEVMDRDDPQSPPATKRVRLYTNGNCGFSAP